MNRNSYLTQVLFVLVFLVGFPFLKAELSVPTNPKIDNSVYAKRLSIYCSPDWTQLNADSIAMGMVPLPGWGDYRWNITSPSDSAVYYFNQGINMYYGFHIIESLASFKKAETFDSTNAMIYWSQALAYGPNINDFGYSATPDALEAAGKAMRFSAGSSPKEKALINAMALRYSADTTLSRETLNEEYARSMLTAYRGFPGDADISALYADARMLQHPWNYWKHNGEAQPWTDEILNVIEKTLVKSPDHPGLNHYHIHMAEASPNPGRALASARRLQNMMPDVSHMVHMPSHIYIRTGNYRDGITANDQSIGGYKKYLGLFPDVVNNVPLYLIHNLHMKAACSILMRDTADAVSAAIECSKSFDTSFLSMAQPIGNMVQYIYMVPSFARLQFGQWNEILKGQEIPSHWIFANALDHFAKGMASAELGDLEKAKVELGKVRSLIPHEQLQVLNAPFNRPSDQLKVAESQLQGMIEFKSNNIAASIDNFRAAVELEDKLVYSEPRDWLLPSRLFLAKALLTKKDLTEAAAVLKQDLVINPHHYHSLKALQQIYTGQKNKKQELKKVERELAATNI